VCLLLKVLCATVLFSGVGNHSLSIWQLIPSLFPLFPGIQCDR